MRSLALESVSRRVLSNWRREEDAWEPPDATLEREARMDSVQALDVRIGFSSLEFCCCWWYLDDVDVDDEVCLVDGGRDCKRHSGTLTGYV